MNQDHITKYSSGASDRFLQGQKVSFPLIIANKPQDSLGKALNSIFSSFIFPTHLKVPTEGKSFLSNLSLWAHGIFSKIQVQKHIQIAQRLYFLQLFYQ